MACDRGCFGNMFSSFPLSSKIWMSRDQAVSDSRERVNGRVFDGLEASWGMNSKPLTLVSGDRRASACLRQSFCVRVHTSRICYTKGGDHWLMYGSRIRLSALGSTSVCRLSVLDEEGVLHLRQTSRHWRVTCLADPMGPQRVQRQPRGPMWA